MRVTVNYGMDFANIPKLLREMMLECDDKIKKADGLLTTVSYSMTKENSEFMASAIHELRTTLAELDLDISEIAMLADNYFDAKKGIEASKELAKEPVEEPIEDLDAVQPETSDEDSQGEIDLGVAATSTVDDLGSQ